MKFKFYQKISPNNKTEQIKVLDTKRVDGIKEEQPTGALQIKTTNKKRIRFSIGFLVTTVLLLAAGMIIAHLLSIGSLDRYFQQKYPLHNKALISYKTTPYKIGFITDTHAYTQSEKKGGKLHPKVTEPMKKFVKQMNNSFHPDFAFENGDFIDGGKKRRGEESIKDFKKLNALFNQIKAPTYHVLGNHELRGFEKSDWLRLTGYKNAHYYLDFKGLRVIVLDGNYRPNKETGGGDSVSHENDIDEFTAGFIPDEQLQWLENLLKNTNHRRKLVFVHFPLFDKTDFRKKHQMLRGAKEVRNILAKYEVNAVFNGHIEEAYHQKIDGVNYYSIPGIYKSNEEKMGGLAYKEAFAEIEFKKNIKVTIYHKDKKTEQYKSFVLE